MDKNNQHPYGDWEYECAKDDALGKELDKQDAQRTAEIEALLLTKGDRS